MIIVAVVVIAGIAVVAFLGARKKKTENLREQFGPEYDRAARQFDDPREAESELRERRKRHKQLELRSLDAAERDQFEERWKTVQADFVDDPSHAVRQADGLVVEVMTARGYPVNDFDRRADDLSVQYPVVTQHYRQARTIAEANEQGTADTEDLRHAVTSYRSLIEALLHDSDGHRDDKDPLDDRGADDRGADDGRDHRRDDDRHQGDERHADNRTGNRNDGRRGDSSNGHQADSGTRRMTERETNS
ncbi:MAG: hypothetical protein M3Z25_09965 [Actinomycetota bacterium]|nr:hypothetical protein [Actinomycetota bacterium]